MKVSQKYLLAALTGLAFLAFPSSAIARERGIDPLKYGGVYYVPSETMIDVPAAPEGYKAVHISTYNRHGARYSESESAYRVLKQAFEAGENSMTPYGKEFADAYLEFEKIAHIPFYSFVYDIFDGIFRILIEKFLYASHTHRDDRKNSVVIYYCVVV